VTQLLAGYEGIFQVQFAGEMVLDVNPRIYGSLPLAVAAGANLPSLWARLVSGESIRPVRGRPGAFYRWLEGDARHFAWAVRTRGASLGALAPRRRTAHSVESIADARPLLRRLRHATGLCRERH